MTGWRLSLSCAILVGASCCSCLQDAVTSNVTKASSTPRDHVTVKTSPANTAERFYAASRRFGATCGQGSVTFIASDGVRRVYTGLALAESLREAFGDRVAVTELTSLLDARLEQQRAGKASPTAA